MPKDVLERWQKELEDDKDIESVLRERIEAYLDQGFGKCNLRNPVIASMVQSALLFNDDKKYKLLSWVIMPNHIHFMLMPLYPHKLSEIIYSIKSYTAHEANKLLNRTGAFWQREYFDRFIRDEDHYRNTFNYILMNPVKAKLCKASCDWPYGSAYYHKKSS